MILAYSAYRRSQIDAVLQAFDTVFVSLGNPVKMGDEYCSEWQNNPIMKSNQRTQVLAIWLDKRDGYSLPYYQVLDENGKPIGNNMPLCDTATVTKASGISIACDSMGNFVVSYSEGDFTTQYLTLQRIAPSGSKLGPPMRYGLTYYSNFITSLSGTPDGAFRLSWYETGTAYPAVYAQSISPTLSPKSPRRTLLSGYPSPQRTILAIATNDAEETFILWVDYSDSYTPERRLKARLFDSNGRALTDTIILDTLSPDRRYSTHGASCLLNNDRSVLCIWSEYAGYGYDTRIHILRRDFAGQDVRKTSFPSGNRFTRVQAVHFEKGRSLVAWSDRRAINALFLDDNDSTFFPIRLKDITSTVWNDDWNAFHLDFSRTKIFLAYETLLDPDRGYDVVATIQKMERFARPIPPKWFALPQNYPNPFNATTNIEFDVPSPAFVTLTFFDVSGRKVAELPKQPLEAWTYTYVWDPTHLPSGVYFYRVKIGLFSQTRKAVVIK